VGASRVDAPITEPDERTHGYECVELVTLGRLIRSSWWAVEDLNL
jgi:hypothetical protein